MLFRTIGHLSATALSQSDAHAMIQHRRAAAGIETQAGNHSFRATGITAYLNYSAFSTDTIKALRAVENFSKTSNP